MRRVRIVEVVGNSEGGGARIVAALVAALDAARFEVTLVAPASEWLADICEQCGARFHPLPLMASRTGSRLVSDLRTLIAEGRPDIVHAHGTRAASYVVRGMPQRTAASDGPAFIYSEHLFSFDARRGLLRLPWYALEWAICRRADIVTTGCEGNARRLVRARWCTPTKIGLSHYGIGLDDVRAQIASPVPRNALGLADDTSVVGTLARMVPQKGLPILLDAIPRVLNDCPYACFVIVGDGPLRTSLEDHAARLGVRERVHFLGSHAEPWRLLANADVIALPTLFEGMHFVAVEALAAGLPVVTTKVGGNPEIVIPGRTGILVPPRQPAALAEGIVTLLENPVARAAMGNAGQEMVRHFDLKGTLVRFAGLYEQEAAKRQTPRHTAKVAHVVGHGRVDVDPGE